MTLGRNTQSWWVAGWVVAALAVLGFLGASARFAAAMPSDAILDQPAPPFVIQRFPGTIQVVPGRTLSLEQLAGRPVVVNFWASWCEDCRGEAALLERLWKEYRDRGVVFVGVAVHDTPHTAEVYVRRAPITFPTGLDASGSIGEQYDLFGVPETVFIAADGRIVRRHAGPLTEQTLRDYLDQLLR